MSSKFKAVNDALNLTGKTALVIGGTQGIGAAIALRLASLGSSVVIVGRNGELGAKMVDQMSLCKRQGQSFSFSPLDVQSMAKVASFCHQFKSNQKTLSFLVHCAGGLNYGPRRETPEGIESTFAQNVLSRYFITRELLPMLQKDSRVLNILGAGNGSKIDLEDMQLTKQFSFIRAADQYATMNDVIACEWNREYASHSSAPQFYHMFPGIVNTASVKNQGFPWFISMPASLVMPWIAASPASVAETAVWVMNTMPGGLIGPNGNALEPNTFVKSTEGLSKRLFDYLNGLLSPFSSSK